MSDPGGGRDTAFAQTIVFVPTLRCPLRCLHCVTESGPDVRREMRPEDAVRWIDDLARTGRVRRLVLSGGEPFVDLERLDGILAAAHDRGLAVSAVTSASWAPNADRARRVLADRPALTEICVSVDRWHVDFLPLDNARRAIEAALSLGRRATVFATEAPGDGSVVDSLRASLDPAALARLEIRREPLHFAGRARGSGAGAIAPLIRWGPLESAADGPCSGPAAPAVLPDGTVLACCGDAVSAPEEWTALVLGSLGSESAAAILGRADANPFLHAIRLLGPKALLLKARAEGAAEGTRPYERANVCDTCRDLAANAAALARFRPWLERAAAEIAAARAGVLGEAWPESAS